VVSRKAENERFKANFDALFQRVQETINPVEYGAATAYQPLLHNLLILAQRKSLANWHREADPTLREAKQILMTNLLGARKKGDVMTVVEMYQQHVGGDTTFSKADEKELIAALEYQIAELDSEKLDVIEQSPLHAEIHKRFYSTSKKRVDDSIDKHLREVRRDKLEIEQQAGSIRSLKTLKPWLEKRYEEEMLDSPFGRFGQDFDFSRDWPF
jgi:hypothetical protein